MIHRVLVSVGVVDVVVVIFDVVIEATVSSLFVAELLVVVEVVNVVVIVVVDHVAAVVVTVEFLVVGKSVTRKSLTPKIENCRNISFSNSPIVTLFSTKAYIVSSQNPFPFPLTVVFRILK